MQMSLEKKEAKFESRTAENPSGEVKVAKKNKKKKTPLFYQAFLFLIPRYAYHLMKGNTDEGNRKQIVIATSLTSKSSAFKQMTTSI